MEAFILRRIQGQPGSRPVRPAVSPGYLLPHQQMEPSWWRRPITTIPYAALQIPGLIGQRTGQVRTGGPLPASSDGSKIVAVGDIDGPIYTSTNFGITWAPAISAPSNWWQSVASSADGSKLVAVSQLQYPAVDGSIFTSTNSGMTWTSNDIPSEPWSSVASSADGIKLVAVAYNMSFSSGSGFSYAGGIFTSTNSGATWTKTIGPSNFWYAAAASADVNKLVVAVRGGGIYISQTTPSPQLNLASANGKLAFHWPVPSANFLL